MIAVLFFRMGPNTGCPKPVLADLSPTDRGIQGDMPLWSLGEARDGEAGGLRRLLGGGRIPLIGIKKNKEEDFFLSLL